MLFTDVTSRARAFGLISGMGGVGAAAGPLIGGLITTTISWRASFLLQGVIVLVIVMLSRKLVDPVPPDPTRPFDASGAALSAIGMILLVIGILQADSDPLLFGVLVAAGAAFQLWFFLHIRSKERAGHEPLLSTSLFRNRTSNLALVTQNIQWLMLMGISFVVSVYLQVVLGYSAIQTGLVFTAATVGVLVSSLMAERLARRYAQRSLIMFGFALTVAGVALILVLSKVSDAVILVVPGLLMIGLGVGSMLTPSVNVVQSAFPEERQGEISGLSRSVSNLGSSLGTAIAGTILVSNLAAKGPYAVALFFLGVVGLIGLGAAWLLPSDTPPESSPVA
jgi:MFS family permease